MSHYEYDHGDCYDKAGNTTGDMLRMYDDSDRLQQGTIARSRPSMPGFSGGGGAIGLPPSAYERWVSMTTSAVRLLTFTPHANSPAIDDLTHGVPPAYRARARGIMRDLLRDYRTYVASRGFAPNLLSTAYFISLVSAYTVYDGDRWSASTLANQTLFALTLNLAGRPEVAHANNATLQRLNDDLALTGGTLLYVAGEARAHHDSAALARIRGQALGFLVRFHHLDPRRTRLDDTYCLAMASMLVVSCAESKWLATAGKVGRSPFASQYLRRR